MTKDFFKFSERKTTYKKEILGGLTTFLAMAYIVFVHPNILAETGMNRDALIVVTCLISFFGTLLVGIWANMPFAMAPGLGLNTFFTYSLVIGKGIDWQTAKEIALDTKLSVIASGGVASLADVQLVKSAGLHGVIIGRALYDNQLSLAEVLAC